MAYYYKDKQFIDKFLRAQLTILKNTKEILIEIKKYEPLKKFDKKVVNKKIKECVSEYGKTNKDLKYITLRISETRVRDVYLELTLNKPTDSENYYFNLYNDTCTYRCPLIDDKRFNYPAFIESVDKSIAKIDKSMEEVIKEIDNLQQTLDEYESIINSVENFKKNHASYINNGLHFRRL